jgi:hypothetical protein
VRSAANTRVKSLDGSVENIRQAVQDIQTACARAEQAGTAVRATVRISAEDCAGAVEDASGLARVLAADSKRFPTVAGPKEAAAAAAMKRFPGFDRTIDNDAWAKNIAEFDQAYQNIDGNILAISQSSGQLLGSVDRIRSVCIR